MPYRSQNRKETALVKNDENSSTARLGKPTTRTEWKFILLGCALLGSASTLIIILLIQRTGLRFPLLFFLIALALGALSGIIVALIVRKHDGSKLASFAFACLVGLILPICLLQMLFLIFPLDP